MSDSIVLLHATPVAMQPIHAAMRELWPDAAAVHLLDEGLSLERAKTAALTDALAARFIRFGRYAADTGADGILATCSAFGDPLDKLAEQLAIPVLKPNEAMFADALAAGGRVGMLATFAPAIAGMEHEFYAMAARLGKTASLTTLCAEGAIEQLRAGHDSEHNAIVAQYAERLADCDVIMLAHFSTSRALAQVRAVSGVPVLAAPQSAVLRMKARVRQNKGKTSC
ncbi:aspartate/glutamate racemase family protein [Martelella alba]|uniref:Arylsulfatase n=1 Tax=Martelella alba TaxID=2590451 RepID=A0ABY2SHG3_9HYPH|nr:aspartate/glutamate racemase family protein [Martelella alba]TKI04095.1 arylsulfatase [Martelella alba]